MPAVNLWNQPGIPHFGWGCLDVFDLGEAVETCQMCGKESIRYVHTMRHSEFPDVLRVGCICAEKMSGDYINPKKREKELRNKAKCRANWLRRSWRVSAKGHRYINQFGYNLGVYQTKYGKFGYWIQKEDQRWSNQAWFNTFEAAAYALFELFWQIRNEE